MRILGIESSSLVASVALVTDDIVTAEYTVNFKKTHSQTLLPMLDEISRMVELDLATVDAIAVSAGPGSFTGLRIGSATGKGLGLALKKPLIHIPTVDAMAYNLYGCASFICPIMDARRSQVYTGLYDFSAGFRVLKEQCPMDMGELIGELNLMGKKVVFLGDGVPVYRDLIAEKMTAPYEFAPAHVSRQRAAAVAALGCVYYREGRVEKAEDHKPDYLRKSQAEREREAELTGNAVSETKFPVERGPETEEGELSRQTVIREMAASDLVRVSDIEQQSFPDPWPSSLLESTRKNSLDTVLVLEEDHDVAGYLIYRTAADEMELFKIAVRPESRGLGYGKKLMDAMAENARKLKTSSIFLEVRESNHWARNLYKTCGFDEISIRRAYYHDPEEDALILVNRLI